MKRYRVLLSLITQDNDYQREQAAVAETTAARLGMDLTVVYAANNAITQTEQILAAVHGAPRPDAIIAEPVGTGMLGVAKSAVDAGIGWIVLNREADYLAPLRQAAKVPVGSVECDNAEVGRIQGRQFAALLPAGGAALYVLGPGTDVVKQRKTGLDETLPKSITLQTARGKWTEESGQQFMAGKLERHGTRPPDVALIGCQNDAMAMGARKAVEAMTNAAARDAWLKVPFTGVDGVAASGQTWVRQGQLAATVVVPALTGVALELLAKGLGSGTQIAERTLTKPASFPAVEELRAPRR